MSGTKYIDKICLAGIILSVVLMLLFVNGEALGVQKVTDEDAQASEVAEQFTDNDMNGSWDTSSAVQIVMEGDDGTISGNGAYFLDGNLVIAAPGKYVISGTLEDGSIIVDFEQSAKVWIMLAGVDITCSDDACFRVDEADKVFLTLAQGSENRMESGETYSEEALEDGTGGVIYSHDDLTINGSGSLTIEAGYKHGIESNDDLVITGGTISITCPEDGMHANDKLKIAGASITVNAGDDALHCDTEVYIESGTILLESCYEGIEATQITIDGGDITIYPSDDGINANGGEDSFGFEPMTNLPDVGEAMSETGSAQSSDTDEETPSITINGGTVTVINGNGRDADGLDSNGDIIINGGTVFVSMDGSGGNNGLDYGSENGGQCLINGGVVIACADSSMMEEISDASEQCTLTYVPDETVSAGATVSMADADGNTILVREIPCSFSSLVLSSPELKQGQTYTLSVLAGEAKQGGSKEAEAGGDTGADIDTNKETDTDTDTDTDKHMDTDAGADAEDSTGAVSVEVTFDETVVSIGSAGGFSMNGMPGPGFDAENMSEGQRPDFGSMDEDMSEGQGAWPDFGSMNENMSEGQRPDFGSMDENGIPAMPEQNMDTAEDENGTPAMPEQNTGTAEDENADMGSPDTDPQEMTGTEAATGNTDENFRPEMPGEADAMPQGGGPMDQVSPWQEEAALQSEAGTASGYDASAWIWVIICAAVLLFGIIFAKNFS